jgi:hypothetical protein
MKGGESLGNEESSKEEEEVVPSLILASGVRPLAPDVKSYLSDPTSHAFSQIGTTLRRRFIKVRRAAACMLHEYFVAQTKRDQPVHPRYALAADEAFTNNEC